MCGADSVKELEQNESIEASALVGSCKTASRVRQISSLEVLKIMWQLPVDSFIFLPLKLSSAIEIVIHKNGFCLMRIK